PPAVPARGWPGALSALHRPHRARLARQADAMAPGARRVAGQRRARGAISRVPGEAAARQASRPRRFQALRERLRSPPQVLALRDRRERPACGSVPRLRAAPGPRPGAAAVTPAQIVATLA